MKRIVLIIVVLLITGTCTFSQVSINTDGAAPDNSAMLDVKSTAKGILLPRMTLAQRNTIANPANGLMIYQTDNNPGFYYNSGTAASPAWVITGSGWGLTGNSGTSAATNFIGTTDNVPLVFKVNNQLSGRISITGGNLSLGYQALEANTGGTNCTAIGFQSLNANLVGDDNTACGSYALAANSSGFRNTAMGSNALFTNTTGDDNTAIGSSALENNTTGNSNTALGRDALQGNTIGSSLTATGYRALFLNTTGNENTANGYIAMYCNTTGVQNTASGSNALFSNTTGSYNTAFGYKSLFDNSTGDQNTATGVYALTNNSTGYQNTANGAAAMFNNTTGVRNTATGYSALEVNTTGSDNTANGTKALQFNSTGTNNTGIGAYALYLNSTGVRNTASGSSALYNSTGSDNTAHGAFALKINTTGYSNTATGSYAMELNTIGSNNTASGFNALHDNITGYSNTAHGVNAMSLNFTGHENTAIGFEAMKGNTQGVDNTSCGFSAGSASDVNNFCSFFGWDADQLTGTDYNNSTAIGYQSRITDHGQVRIGSSAVTSIGGFAGWTNLSDGRYKKDVKENVPGLAFINQLKPVTYHLDVTGLRKFLGEDVTGEEGQKEFREQAPEQKAIIDKGVKAKEKITYTGFIAQDVEKAANELGFDFSGVDKPQNETSLYGLRYAEFVVPLVKAVQELNDVNGTYADAIKAMKLEIQELKATNEILIGRLEKFENK